MDARLPDATFRLLRDFIHEQCGIYVPDTKKYLLETRLARRLVENGAASFDDYLAGVRANGQAELPHLFDAVTTNETYFHREPQQLDVFVSHVVPRVFERRGTKDIRIWSCACSTGEEPYTLAGLVRDHAPDARCDILASDISETALESARRGLYNSYSVRLVPEAFQRRYLRRAEDLYELDESLRRAVRFQNINLVDEKRMKTVMNVDVVFCRNVLIYFDDRAKQKAVSLLYDALVPQGILVVGASESLHNVTRAFKPVIVNKVILYQKG